MPGSDNARHTGKRRAAVICAAAFVTLFLANPVGALTPSYSPSPPPQTAPTAAPGKSSPKPATPGKAPATKRVKRAVCTKAKITRKAKAALRKRPKVACKTARRRAANPIRKTVRRPVPKLTPKPAARKPAPKKPAPKKPAPKKPAPKKLAPKLTPKPVAVTPEQAPATLPGREVYRADWETNSFNQAAGVQRIADDRIQLVTNPVAQGKYAARFEVRPGDNPVCCGDRAEISTNTAEVEGMERYYEWWTRFDGSFPNAAWQAVSQWHSGIDGIPPVAFYAEDGRYRLQTWPRDGGGNSLGGPHILWNVPLQRDSWYHIVMHVKWSSNDSVGFIEMNVNGKNVVPKTLGRNMLPGSGNYFKQGYYRAFGIGQTGVIYHDGFRVTQVSP